MPSCQVLAGRVMGLASRLILSGQESRAGRWVASLSGAVGIVRMKTCGGLFPVSEAVGDWKTCTLLPGVRWTFSGVHCVRITLFEYYCHVHLGY